MIRMTLTGAARAATAPLRQLVLHTRPGAALLLKGRKAAPPAFTPDASPGATVLGQTRSKKPVFASGAETASYTPDDHADAARLHHDVHQHHETQASDHDDGAATDGDWRRSESRAQDAGRHRKLADHHHELARDHLIAAGRSSQVEVNVHGGGVQAGKPAPHADDEKQAALQRLKARKHASHPGGVTPQDTAAYHATARRAS